MVPSIDDLPRLQAPFRSSTYQVSVICILVTFSFLVGCLVGKLCDLFVAFDDTQHVTSRMQLDHTLTFQAGDE